jgi:hypothetical protein
LLEALYAIIEIDVQIPLPTDRAFCLMLKRLSPALQAGHLPLQFVNLDGQIDQAAIREHPFERTEPPLDLGQLEAIVSSALFLATV